MKNKTRILLMLLCLIIAGGSIGYIAHYYSVKQRNSAVYDELQKTAVTETVAKESQKAETNDTDSETKTSVDIPIDFESLWDINPEIYAWIEIPDTNVAYPVLQSPTDDIYYLDHTVEGYSGYPGSIYTERQNSKKFTDFNTVIYGHDMDDGSMFGSLSNYRDSEYMDSHSELIIYTPDHKFTYRIFHAVEYDDRHILNTFDFSSKDARQEFLESTGVTDSDISTDSRIVTLSTCVASASDHRFLVEAVLINEE